MNPFDTFRKDPLASKTTLITGGATGLGRAMAERMAGLGAKITVIVLPLNSYAVRRRKNASRLAPS